MGGVIKGVGKILGAPIHGIGHALKTSGIPLISGLGGTVENAGEGFEGKKPFFKSVLPAAALGLGGAGLLGAGPLGGMLGGVGGDIGKLATGLGKALPIGLHGGQALDVGKLAGGAMGIANLAGAERQRGQAQNYNNAMIDQRNQLMQAIMGKQGFNPTGQSGPNITPAQNYNPRGINLNQQSSATSGGY